MSAEMMTYESSWMGLTLKWASIGLFGYVLATTLRFIYLYHTATQSTTDSYQSPAILIVLGGEEEREYAGIELVRRGLRMADQVKGNNLFASESDSAVSSKETIPRFHFIDTPPTHPPTFLIVSSGHFQTNHTAFRPLQTDATSTGSCDYVSPSEEYPGESCYIADHRAIDTVSNFTTLVRQLAGTNSYSSPHQTLEEQTWLPIPSHLIPAKHVYILTSDYHMTRALAVGRIILSAGYGIGITPIRIADPHSALELRPSSNAAASLLACHPSSTLSTAAQNESWFRTSRDMLRALSWIYFGIDGTWFSRLIHPQRWTRAVRQQKEDIKL